MLSCILFLGLFLPVSHCQLVSKSRQFIDDLPVSINGRRPKLDLMEKIPLSTENHFSFIEESDPEINKQRQFFVDTYWHCAAFYMPTRSEQKVEFRPDGLFDDPLAARLCEAILDANVAEMERLIAAGADVNATGRDLTSPEGTKRRSNTTPLLMACYVFDDYRPFECLLKHGANPNIVCVEGGETGRKSVVHLTAAYDYNRLFKSVFESGGDPNLKADFGGSKDVTPFLLLSTGVNAPDAKERLALLTNKGAKLDDTDGEGCTLLIRYLRNAPINYVDQACELAIQLIEAGANPKSFHQVERRNDYAPYGCYLRPIHYASFLSKPNNVFVNEGTHLKKLIEVLEQQGESLEAAEADLKRWMEWKYGGHIAPTAQYPQGLIIPERSDFEEAIEAEHQQWLKEQEERLGK